MRRATGEPQQPARIELVDANRTQHRHVAEYFRGKQVDGVANSRVATDRRCIGEGSPDENETRAQRESLKHIGAAPSDASVFKRFLNV